MPETIVVAREKARARAVNLEQRTETVAFEFEDPIGIVEGSGAPLQHERGNFRKCGRHDGGIASKAGPATGGHHAANPHCR